MRVDIDLLLVPSLHAFPAVGFGSVAAACATYGFDAPRQETVSVPVFEPLSVHFLQIV